MDGESKEVGRSDIVAVVDGEVVRVPTAETSTDAIDVQLGQFFPMNEKYNGVLSPGPSVDGPDARGLHDKIASFTPPFIDESGERYPPDIMPKLGPPFPDYATIAKRAQEKLDPFLRTKTVTFRGGPADGEERTHASMPADGLICFFQNNNGTPEQAVYKMQLKEVERTEEQRKAGAAIEWEWIAEYQGKRRYIPLGTVNGIRKGS